MIRANQQPDDLDRLIDELDHQDPGTKNRIDALAELAALRRHLRARRTGLGMTQAAVARRMGVSQAAVSHLEAGADVTVTKLARYLYALGISDWSERLVGR